MMKMMILLLCWRNKVGFELDVEFPKQHMSARHLRKRKPSRPPPPIDDDDGTHIQVFEDYADNSEDSAFEKPVKGPAKKAKKKNAMAVYSKEPILNLDGKRFHC